MSQAVLDFSAVTVALVGLRREGEAAPALRVFTGH